MSDRVIVRLANPELDHLLEAAFARYPRRESGLLVRFGWRQTASDLVLTLANVEDPGDGDLDLSRPNVAFTEQFLVRTALLAERDSLAIGVVHSHPEGHIPHPSHIDDNMDSYLSSYFEGFAPGRPYVSLIASRVDGRTLMSARVKVDGRWLEASRFLTAEHSIVTWRHTPAGKSTLPTERVARLRSAFGDEAVQRLRDSTVAVVGAGGTGSAVIEVLARAGVGKIVMIDPDRLEQSNLERVHGSRPAQATSNDFKVNVAREHVLTIDPSIEVITCIGRIPQAEVVDLLVSADVAIGCTDSQHSRLALSDIAIRYLLPAIDCGVLLEGAAGHVTGQIMQLVRFLPSDPCASCRDMADPVRVTQEMMSDRERRNRQIAAAEAVGVGADGGQYWSQEPQLNTVGYLTTAAGALAAGQTIGWLTGRFPPRLSRLQMNLSEPFFDVTEPTDEPRPSCACRSNRGWADQGGADALISPATHWPKVVVNGVSLP
ncbi:MAG: ThiF family adenylyltransferase [Chloroflexota bacterium]|nr:ThiF family adenylyltransferase [Chloroflexota bacterium]